MARVAGFTVATAAMLCCAMGTAAASTDTDKRPTEPPTPAATAPIPAAPDATAPGTTTPAATAPGATAPATGASGLPPVVVTAPEPRYVAPTRRDRIGRIWAPVYIDGKGPFRLVLDSGATASGVNQRVARELGLPMSPTDQVLLRGVVGLVPVPVVHVDSLTVGDLIFGARRMPVVTDPLGGADGILSTAGMDDARIYIDFHHDLIQITHSRGQRPGIGFVTIPIQLVNHQLVVADASIGGVRAMAIIDTGGQVTIANLAMRRALAKWRAQLDAQPDKIEDVTKAIQGADRLDSPPIEIGTGLPDSTVKISNDRMTFGDMHIFQHWGMTAEPAMMIGMDTLGLLDILIIDYKRHELQIRLNSAD